MYFCPRKMKDNVRQQLFRKLTNGSRFVKEKSFEELNLVYDVTPYDIQEYIKQKLLKKKV